MAQIKLFGNLRQITGRSSYEVDARTVMEALEKLREQNATVVNLILEEDGLKKFFKIMVNGYDISMSQGLNTPVQAHDVIAIFPPIAGG